MTDSLMGQIAKLAPTKRHNLSRDMVDGSRQLSDAQARQILTHLYKCADVPGVAHVETPEFSGTVRVRRADPADAMMPRPAGAPMASPSAIDRGGSGQVEYQPSPVLPRLTDLKGIPAGYYATPSGTGNNDLDFWRVDVPKKGKWEGFSFARRILGGGSGTEMRTVDLDNIPQRKALVAIRAAGIEEAGYAFAQAIGRCSACGLVLTDEVSRQRGKGPTCWAKQS